MGVTPIIKFLLLCFSTANILELSHADPPYNVCSSSPTYAANSTFEYNLNSLMRSLPSNASVTKLYNTSIGKYPDRVYSQYMCLNYVTNDTCSVCIASASGAILQLCQNDKEAIVWGENCQLRYSNQNFLGHLDVSGNIPKYNLKNISAPEQFKSVVNKALTGLANKAAFDISTKMYAKDNVPFSDSQTVYALVQCTTDLSPNDCHQCIQVAIENISSCCFASIGARLLSRSCYLRYELYAFYEGATAESSDSQVNHGMWRNQLMWMIIILGLVLAIVVVAFLGSFVYCLAAKNRRGSQEIQLHSIGDPNNIEFQHQNFHGRDGHNAQDSAFMDLASIYAATNKFSDSNMLGQGGFGPVYKGVLSDGQEVAVKRLSRCSEQGTLEFTNEVQLIMKLQHKNLVRLLGFCVDNGEKILVYEFMPNSSLDVILFDPKKRAQLDWSRRTNIINGIAKGILYLHVDSRLRVIHRDLKASNVLLDNDMNPKISDFGMAKIFAGTEDEANTARIVGTYGYMAPEYAMEGLYSTKSDVFGFGVLLLEIITGRRNAGFHKSKRAPSLVAYAWKLWNERNELVLVDPLLADSYIPDEFSRYMHIGLLCVQEDACDRPTMSSVVVMLKNETATLPLPERPAFSVGTFVEHDEAIANHLSANNLTISDLFPR